MPGKIVSRQPRREVGDRANSAAVPDGSSVQKTTDTICHKSDMPDVRRESPLPPFTLLLTHLN